MRIPVRIYYEDTDCGGVVYYANYLKYFERGRTEFLRDRGIELSVYHDRRTVFVVTGVEARYLAPARYGDLLTVDTEVSAATRATITFGHTVTREDGTVTVRGNVTLAAVGESGRPARMPGEVRRAVEG